MSEDNKVMTRQEFEEFIESMESSVSVEEVIILFSDGSTARLSTDESYGKSRGLMIATEIEGGIIVSGLQSESLNMQVRGQCTELLLRRGHALAMLHELDKKMFGSTFAEDFLKM